MTLHGLIKKDSIQQMETANMKCSSQDIPPPAAGIYLSSIYGITCLKGRNCDVNTFLKLSRRMTWSVVSTGSLRSKRIQTWNLKCKHQQGQLKETIPVLKNFISFGLNSLLFTESRSLGK